MTPVIRSHRPEEWDAIAHLWLASWQSTVAVAAQDTRLKYLRERIPRELEDSWSLQIAEWDNTLAAVLALHQQQHYLDQLFVAPDFQNHGIGYALLAVAMKEMPDGIWLRTAAANTWACAWYERRGFTRDHTQPHRSLPHVMVYYAWKIPASDARDARKGESPSASGP